MLVCVCKGVGVGMGVGVFEGERHVCTCGRLVFVRQLVARLMVTADLASSVDR